MGNPPVRSVAGAFSPIVTGRTSLLKRNETAEFAVSNV
jgi:hypothetical protein